MSKSYTLFFSLFFISILLFSGCTQKDSSSAEDTSQTAQGTETQEPSPEFLKGFSLSPKSFSSEDFTGFFEIATKTPETQNPKPKTIISWAGDWEQLNIESSAPFVVSELSSTYKYLPLIEVQFFTQSTGELLRPLDEATKQNYKSFALSFIEKYKPKYFAIGIEVNVLYEKSPEEFDNFVLFFNELYTSIKEISPDTKVFTIFQLEKIKGLNGGLFGGVNDPSKNEWFLLEEFQNSDLFAFTSYPSLIYPNPSEIPADYYSEISSHTSKPIAFAEIGWHSASSPVGWESSEEEQGEFISVFFDRIESLDNEFVLWSFLYDQNTIEPFNSMGLFGSEGKKKLAFDIWKNITSN